MKFKSISEIQSHPGLRIVIVRDFPSPWSQAARAIFEYKGLEYVTGAQIPGGDNPELVAWCGHNSGPVVAYADEPPIHRWLDIVVLAERLAPKPSVLPENGEDRVRVVGLCHEVSGDLGIGWWTRIMMFHPVMEGPEKPEAVENMASKWRYSKEGASRAAAEVASRLALLDAQLAANAPSGSPYMVGDAVTALDFHWAAMASLLAPLPPEIMPLLPGVEPMFEIAGADPLVAKALTPRLLAHRDAMIERHFTTPFDYNES
jgi:glutathione S-transferase